MSYDLIVGPKNVVGPKNEETNKGLNENTATISSMHDRINIINNNYTVVVSEESMGNTTNKDNDNTDNTTLRFARTAKFSEFLRILEKVRTNRITVDSALLKLAKLVSVVPDKIAIVAPLAKEAELAEKRIEEELNKLHSGPKHTP